MLNIRTVGQVAALLGTEEGSLRRTLRRVPRLCDRLTITDLDRLTVKDPERPEERPKPRVVYEPRGPLRALQKAVHEKLLLPSLGRFPASHGGVRGRSVLTAVGPHMGQRFVYSGDVRGFYPSIHFSRVRRLFEQLGCSGEAAGALTRLCTHNHRLEQGFVTSPALADRLFRPADERIARLCVKEGLTYTRFVDDLTISSPFDLEKSGIPALVAKILAGTGFRLNAAKDRFGSMSKGAEVLGLRLVKGRRPDVGAGYLDETVRRLNAMIALGDGGEFAGPYHSRQELWGRLRYALWVNPCRRTQVAALWRAADWKKIEAEADRRGIARRRKRIRVERGGDGARS